MSICGKLSPVLSSFMTYHRGFVSRLTRRVPLVEQKLFTLPGHLSSPPVFSGVRVTQSLVLCVCFVDRCLSVCTFFSFGHCVVWPSSIYGFYRVGIFKLFYNFRTIVIYYLLLYPVESVLTLTSLLSLLPNISTSVLTSWYCVLPVVVSFLFELYILHVVLKRLLKYIATWYIVSFHLEGRLMTINWFNFYWNAVPSQES